MDTSGPSVDFVGSFWPVFVQEIVQGKSCARSLRDGTLFLPTDDPEEVCVWWQGDQARSGVVRSRMICATALVEYVNFCCIGRSADEHGALLMSMANHFEVKTGITLYLPDHFGQPDAFQKMWDLARRVGPEVALDALKKVAGI